MPQCCHAHVQALFVGGLACGGRVGGNSLFMAFINSESVAIYRTLAKEGPWAVHLTLSQDWGMGRYIYFFSRGPHTKQKKNGPKTTTQSSWMHSRAIQCKQAPKQQYTQCSVKGRQRTPRARKIYPACP